MEGLGQSNASRINLLFIAWNYITPILGAALADQYWGRYRTIKNSLLVLFVGSCLLLWSSVVVEDDWSMALGILLAAMVRVGLGAGGVKANSASWVAEQYTKPEGSDTSDNDYEAIVQRYVYMARQARLLELTSQDLHVLLYVHQRRLAVVDPDDWNRTQLWVPIRICSPLSGHRTDGSATTIMQELARSFSTQGLHACELGHACENHLRT